jgi:hypothetical protein
MIKKLILPLIFAVLILFTPQIHAEDNFLFLSYDQFQSLTQSEQRKYIEVVQGLIQKFESMKDFAPNRYSSLLSQMLQWAQAAEMTAAQTIEISPNNNSEEIGKISLLLYRVNIYATILTKDKNSKNPGTNELVKEYFISSYNRIQTLTKKNLTAQEKIGVEKLIKGLRQRYSEVLVIHPDLKNLHDGIGSLATSSSTTRAQATSSTLISSTNATQRNVQLVKTKDPIKLSNVKNSEIRVAAKANSGDSSNTEEPYCIYSGFVLSDKTCSPLTELPLALKLEEINISKFKCGSANEILCNPLVFGFKSDSTPYCIKRSRMASLNCKEISNNSETIERIHKAWKNPANKKVYDSYQSSLKQLCDSNNRSSDVRDTCKVVISQFNETVKKEFPTTLAVGSGSRTDKSLQKN